MTFLLLFSLFTSSELKRHVTSTFREHGFSHYISERESTQRQKQKALLQQFKSAVHEKNPEDLEIEKSDPTPKKTSEKNSKKRCYKLNFDINRPPDNARFNLRPFLLDPTKKLGNKQLISIFEQLLINLYGDAPFFQKIPSFEKVISNALLQEKDKLLDANFADEIGMLDFQEEATRLAFYQMLKGQDAYPSLFNYLALDSQTKPKINMLFAAPELIRAVIGNDHASQRILTFRDNIVAQICLSDTELTRSQISTQLRELIDTVISEESLDKGTKQRFDYLVGKPGRLIFFKDPLTNKQLFEKIPLQKSPQEIPSESENPLADSNE